MERKPTNLVTTLDKYPVKSRSVLYKIDTRSPGRTMEDGCSLRVFRHEMPGTRQGPD